MTFDGLGVTITLGIPDRRLRPNHKPFSRGGAIAKSVEVKGYRRTAYWMTRQEIGSHGPAWQRAVARATWYLGKGQKRLDEDNALATLKPAFDGMQDAGLILNDRGLRHKSPVWFRDSENPRVEIYVVCEDGEPTERKDQ